ncbi:MAG TPA: molybdenum ABC transporter ATP-binding protein [Alphaproteobacteria bacterium]|nr:molybdenum ABC transporter ATP-binding protein [Alphaproteobacteria bacterium]
MSVFDFSAQCRLGHFSLDAVFQAEGRIVGLFGPSGSGKSTILRLIAGLLRPDSGHIAVAGHVVFDSKTGVDLPARRRHVGLVFQDGLLFPHLSVRQNLLYGAWARGKRSGLQLDGTIEILGIGHLLDRAPSRLSGGERQRVAIGRALLSDPAVLLMDEPVTAVDQERRAEILPHLQTLAEHARVPILYVSHAMAEVERLADQIVFLRDGRVTNIT